MKLRIATGLAIAATLLSGVTACASTGAGGTGEAGTVYWYSSKAPEYNDALLEGFAKTHPDINVEVMRAITGDLTVRYSSERSAGADTADVVTQSDDAFLQEGFAQDWWVTDSKPAEGWPDEAYEKGVVTASYHEMLLGYNTNVFPEGSEPSSWEDLLNPAYKGRLNLIDPRGEPGYLAFYEVLAQKYGDDFLPKLAAQEPRFVTSAVPGNEAVAAGGADVMVPTALSSANAIIQSGAPVKLKPISPSTTIEVYTVVSNEAKAPEAAAAFFEYLTSKEGQELFNGEVTSSARSDVVGPPALSEDLVPLREVLPKALENKAEIIKTLGIN